MFSELPQSVIWCLSLLLENSQPLVTSTISSVAFFLSSPDIPSHTCYDHCNCSTVFGYFISLFPYILFSLHISIQEVSVDTSSNLISFLSYVQFAGKPFKDAFVSALLFLTSF